MNERKFELYCSEQKKVTYYVPIGDDLFQCTECSKLVNMCYVINVRNRCDNDPEKAFPRGDPKK